ncbi:MAG: hypothetical protein O2887_07025 [Bacteroidetes bacterium]|nr:hypothetical protein [Bacteroidota bacterium]MDA1120232.1 hypothetical protein [Bacteroidota bacterium]
MSSTFPIFINYPKGLDREIVSLQSDLIYYRLKQVDYDGEFEYSNTVVALYDDFEPYTLLIRPNPFSDRIIVNIDATAATEGLLKLYEPVGREVHSEQVTISEGINELDLGQLDHYPEVSIC